MTRKADHRFVKTIVVYIIVDQGNLPGQDGSIRRLELVVATGRQGDTLAVTHFTIPPLSSREDCNATPYPPFEVRLAPFVGLSAGWLQAVRQPMHPAGCRLRQWLPAWIRAGTDR